MELKGRETSEWAIRRRRSVEKAKKEIREDERKKEGGQGGREMPT